jgi:hypothetical protein
MTSPIRVAVSHGKQSLEELPIASEGDPKVLPTETTNPEPAVPTSATDEGRRAEIDSSLSGSVDGPLRVGSTLVDPPGRLPMPPA